MAAVLSPALGGMLDAPTSTTWLGVPQKAGLHATWSSNDSDSESSDYASTPSISPRQPLAKSASGILASEDGLDDSTDAQPGSFEESIPDSCNDEAQAYGPARPLQARLVYVEEVDLLRLGVVVHHENETLDDTFCEADTAAGELLPILPPIEISLQKKSGQFYQPGATGPSCSWPKSSFYPLADSKPDTQAPTDTTTEDHSDSPILPRTPSPTANPSSPVWPSTSSSSPTSSSDGARSSSSSSMSQDKPDADQEAAETFYDVEEPTAPTAGSKDSAATIAGAAASLQAWVDSSEGSKQPAPAAAPSSLRKKRVSFARLPDIDEQADMAAADEDTTDDDAPADKPSIAAKDLPAAAAAATAVGTATPPAQSPARAPATPSPRREPAADSLEGISARFAAITANLNLRLESASRSSPSPRPTPSTSPATAKALPTPQPASSAPRSLSAAVAATAAIATTAATTAAKSIPAPTPAPAPRAVSQPISRPAQQAAPIPAPTMRAKPVLAPSSEIVAAPTATAVKAPAVARAAVATAPVVARPAIATTATPVAVAQTKPAPVTRPTVITQKDLEMQSINNNGYEPSKTFWSLFMWNRTANVTRKADYVPATNLGYEKALLERKAAEAAAKAGAHAGEEVERTPSVALGSCGKAAPKV